MAGNIKIVNEAVNKYGKRTGDFTIIQNSVLKELEGQGKLLNCYMAILRRGRAGSEFNLNFRSLSTALHCSKSTVQKAVDELEKLGLLEIKMEKETDGGANSVKTQDGRTVSNNRRIYIIHSVLKGTPQMLKPGAFIAADFSADEINEAAQETVPEVIEPPPREYTHSKTLTSLEPPQVVQEMPPREYTPPSTPAQKPIYKNADIQALIERRKQHIYNIAATQGVFSKTQKAMLLTWIERFKSEVKRPAADDDITHIANLIGGDNKDLEKLLTGYIADRIPQEKAV